MTDSLIETAADAVRAGDVIVFPTDTVYGIGCDPFNERAIEAIYDAKRRPRDNYIPVLVDSVETARELGKLTPKCEEIIARHWPGSLTVIVEQKVMFPNILTDNGKVALRQPNHEDLLELISSLGGALAATSANISGKPPITAYDDAYAQFSSVASVVLPGVVRDGIASTIVDCTQSTPTIVRQGAVSLE